MNNDTNILIIDLDKTVYFVCCEKADDWVNDFINKDKAQSRNPNTIKNYIQKYINSSYHSPAPDKSCFLEGEFDLSDSIKASAYDWPIMTSPNLTIIDFTANEIFELNASYQLAPLSNWHVQNSFSHVSDFYKNLSVCIINNNLANNPAQIKYWLTLLDKVSSRLKTDGYSTNFYTPVSLATQALVVYNEKLEMEILMDHAEPNKAPNINKL